MSRPAEPLTPGGKFVMPGVVDEHVHIIDMDLKNRYGRFELDSESGRPWEASPPSSRCR